MLTLTWPTALLFSWRRAALSLSTQFFIACIALPGVTTIVTLSVFFVALRYWAVQILRCDAKLLEHINLVLAENVSSWEIDLQNRELPWPSVPWEWATVAAISVILIETILFGGEPEAHILWYVVAVSVAMIVFSIYFIVPHLWPETVQRLVRVHLVALVTQRSDFETNVIKDILRLWHEILDFFTSAIRLPDAASIRRPRGSGSRAPKRNQQKEQRMRPLHLDYSIDASSPRSKTMTVDWRRDEAHLNRLFRFCVRRWQALEIKRSAPFHGTAFEEFIHRSNLRLWAHRWFVAVRHVERLRAYACTIDVEARSSRGRIGGDNRTDPDDCCADGTNSG
jgi:hypothetical protein